MMPPDPFVPLTAVPAPPSPREFRVALLNRHDHEGGEGKVAPSSAFQTLENAKPVAAAGEKKVGEPRVTVQRDGDRITHLRIQCSCGQILDLACVYEPPAAKK
jgi:hypothetical protein